MNYPKDMSIYKPGVAETIPVKICATKKNRNAIAKLPCKRKKQEIASEDTLLFNNYIVLVTMLPSEILAKQIQELYRWRWQVELYFKRLKSILDFGELPKKTTQECFCVVKREDNDSYSYRKVDW